MRLIVSICFDRKRPETQRTIYPKHGNDAHPLASVFHARQQCLPRPDSLMARHAVPGACISRQQSVRLFHRNMDQYTRFQYFTLLFCPFVDLIYEPLEMLDSKSIKKSCLRPLNTTEGNPAFPAGRRPRARRDSRDRQDLRQNFVSRETASRTRFTQLRTRLCWWFVFVWSAGGVQR